MKKILKYIIIFVITIIMLITLLITTTKISKNKIIDNIEDSLDYLSEGREIKYIKRKHPFMWRHIYADEILLNIIYNIDNTNTLQSVLEAKYYFKGYFSLKYELEHEEVQPNNEYMRYWHGEMIFVRPLLMIFNIEQIYIFNAVILGILLLILLYVLWKEKVKFLIPVFLVALIMTGTVFVPFCLEYYWVFLIMFIISILTVKIACKENNKLYTLFFISGILTCFFDFLTTEELTILVPLIFAISIRMKRNKEKSLKENLKFIISSMIIWFIGYTLTWFAKWGLASIVLHVNALDHVVDKALIRINNTVIGVSYLEMLKDALIRNLFALYPLNLMKNKKLLIMLPIVLIIIYFIFRKKEKNYKKIIPYLIISLVPYIRYIILANHSYAHYFFTFRLQYPVIMSILLIFYFSIDRKKIKKDKNDIKN